MTATELRAQYESGLYIVPPHMMGGVQRYLESGIRPGDFLLSLLLDGPRAEEPWRLADTINQFSISEWTRFFYDHMPAIAWGSETKVKAWIAMGGLSGMPEAKS